MPSILATLTPNEREALSTCGILNDAQLAKANPDALLRDLRMAKDAFPEADFDISEAKLRNICAQASGAAEASPLQEEKSAAPVPGVSENGGDDDIFADDMPEAEEEQPRALPELALRRHQHRSAKRMGAALTEAPGVASSVHCARPITTYIAALSMLAFYIGIFGLLLLPFAIFAGYLDGAYLFLCAYAFIALLLPYLFVGIWCHCSVCKMNFFRLVPYNLNRHAHTVPFLGLTTLVTALHIIFFLWYRCPACGTAIRLFRSRHSHRRH